MDELSAFLRRHAILSPDDPWEHAPIAEMLRGAELRPLAAGLQARVFRLEGSPWVLKEGRWDLEIELMEGVKLPLYAELTERVLNNFSFTFLPTEEQIRRQIGHYLLAQRYYGFLPDHEQDGAVRRALAQEQRDLRDALPELAGELARAYRLRRHEGQMKALLEDKAARTHHFLPEEHLVLGPSLSPENKGKPTSFIFQEFVEGIPLHDVELPSIARERRKEMAVWLLLTLAMHRRERMLPDTRPRYPLSQSYDWLSKTDNIFVSDAGVKFIDTRWFWDIDGNVVQRGGLIPDMTLRGIRTSLITLLDSLA